MARRAAIASVLVLLVAGLIGMGAGAATAAKPEIRHGHEYAARGAGPGGGGSNLVNHGGPILTSADVTPIFWGTSWNGYGGDKETGIDKFYEGLGGSSYAGTNTEYTSSNGRVLSGGVSSHTHLTDFSTAPSGGPSTATIVAEVSKMISSPTPNGYYPVYVDKARGSAGYCAWHDTGIVHNVQVQVAFFFNLDGDSGCDPQDTRTVWSQGLEAIANVSGHEISEAVTDPHLNAWYDRRGYENADKCAWTFNGLEAFTNGYSWKIQGNWSNAASAAGTGYTKGCINGN